MSGVVTSINWLILLVLPVNLCHKCIPDYVDLKKKRKAFDTIMAVRRLQEEKGILVTEMEHHWRTLSACAHDLKELACIVSSGTMSSMYCDMFC